MCLIADYMKLHKDNAKDNIAGMGVLRINMS